MYSDKLDTSWIESYENIEKGYEMFYKENINTINITLIYVNRKLEIDKIAQHNLNLKKYNFISKEEILNIIKSNSDIGNIKYKLLSLLTYNIDINHDGLKSFLESDVVGTNDTFLHSLSSMQDVILSPAIQLFHDINSLILVYYETQPIMDDQRKGSSSKTTTKKVYMNRSNVSKPKKTRRHV
jgi:hypothetical protein